MQSDILKMSNLGDKEAIANLYKKYNRLVFSVSLSVVKNIQDAQDISSETFVKIITSNDSFKGSSIKAYLATIARNLSLNFIKKRRREHSVDFDENEHMLGCFEFEETFSKQQTLKTALKKLTSLECQIVIMTNNGLKKREIAKILGEPHGTISWRYSKALKELKEYLK